MVNVVFPVLYALDSWVSLVIPLGLRVAIWGGLCGAAAMAVYALLSNQAAITALKADIRQIRRRIFEVPADAPMPIGLLLENLRVSFALLGRVLVPSLLSTVPVLLVAVWLDSAFGYAPVTDAKTVDITLVTVAEDGQTSPYQAQDGHGLVVLVADGALSVAVGNETVYRGNPFVPAVPVVAKRQWWNALLGAEAGYVAPDAPFDEVHLAVSPKRILQDLPAWAAGWELLFFVAVFVSAIFLKFRFRIQ